MTYPLSWNPALAQIAHPLGPRCFPFLSLYDIANPHEMQTGNSPILCTLVCSMVKIGIMHVMGIP